MKTIQLRRRGLESVLHKSAGKSSTFGYSVIPCGIVPRESGVFTATWGKLRTYYTFSQVFGWKLFGKKKALTEELEASMKRVCQNAKVGRTILMTTEFVKVRYAR